MCVVPYVTFHNYMLKLADEANFSYLKEELEDFLEDCVKNILLPDVSQKVNIQHDLEPKHTTVITAITDVIKWARNTKRHGLFKVSL